MYKCNSCGAVFDEFEIHREYHSEVDASEYWSCCPNCGDGDFEEEYDEETETPEDGDTCQRRHMKFNEVCKIRKEVDEVLNKYGLEIQAMVIHGGCRYHGEIEIQEIIKHLGMPNKRDY